MSILHALVRFTHTHTHMQQGSPPEDDDRGPDRRRQRGGGRGGGRGNFGRRGRFRGGSRGYRNQRQGRGWGGASGWNQNNTKTDEAGGWPQEPPQNVSPKPQRPTSGGGHPHSDTAPSQTQEKLPNEGEGQGSKDGQNDQ